MPREHLQRESKAVQKSSCDWMFGILQIFFCAQFMKDQNSFQSDQFCFSVTAVQVQYSFSTRDPNKLLIKRVMCCLMLWEAQNLYTSGYYRGHPCAHISNQFSYHLMVSAERLVQAGLKPAKQVDLSAILCTIGYMKSGFVGCFRGRRGWDLRHLIMAQLSKPALRMRPKHLHIEPGGTLFSLKDITVELTSHFCLTKPEPLVLQNTSIFSGSLLMV